MRVQEEISKMNNVIVEEGETGADGRCASLQCFVSVFVFVSVPVCLCLCVPTNFPITARVSTMRWPACAA